jgi:hypothetical protein
MISLFIVGTALFLICTAMEFVVASSSGKLEQHSSKGINGEYESSIEWVWQAPDKVDGILFLAHGCNHNAQDFWEKSEGCPSCIGLPEETKMVNFALENNYFVVAVSSLERCWDIPQDSLRVLEVIRVIRKTHKLSDVPLFAIGVSSGGAFVARLPLFAPQVAAVAIQIMAARPASLLLEMPLYPPSIWICMEKDLHTLAAVRHATTVLRSRGRYAEMVVAPALPITPHFFSDRIPNFPRPHIDASTATVLSAKIHSRLRSAGMLDRDGLLLEDPRQTAWRDALRDLLETGQLLRDTLEADKSPISEELNVAFAGHEITADFMRETMQFFLTHHQP